LEGVGGGILNYLILKIKNQKYVVLPQPPPKGDFSFSGLLVQVFKLGPINDLKFSTSVRQSLKNYG
jgi:hypothetical protein